MANIINSLTFGSGTYVITLPYATCSTAAGTAAKVATITPGSNFSLETGARVSVKFDAANSVSSPTLNINQSGAKTIRFRGAALTSSLFYWAAGSVVDFVYDGTYWNMTGSPHNYDSNTTYTFNGAVSTIKDSNLTASRALVSDTNGKVAVSAVTSTELGYLDGVTSNIQTQLNSKLPTSGGNVTGHIYLTGASGNSSTANTSQLVFGTSSDNHVAISSNNNAIVINPTTSSTTNQIVLYLDSPSVFPSGIQANVTGNASTATNVAWSGVTSKPSYYDAKAITSISRSGTTFTATYLDGTTATFSQQDNNTNTAHSHTAGNGISLSGSGGTSGTTTISLAASGVTASSYGPSANASPAHSGTFSVPYITVDTYGRITSASTKTITLPASGNTDTKVTQAAAITATTSANYPVMLGYSTATTAVTNTLNKSAKLLFNTGTGALTVGSGSSAGSGTLTVDGDIIAGGGNDSYGIHPKTSNYSTLGKSNKYWYKVYSANVYTNSLKKLDGTDYSFTMTWNTF